MRRSSSLLHLVSPSRSEKVKARKLAELAVKLEAIPTATATLDNWKLNGTTSAYNYWDSHDCAWRKSIINKKGISTFQIPGIELALAKTLTGTPIKPQPGYLLSLLQIADILRIFLPVRGIFYPSFRRRGWPGPIEPSFGTSMSWRFVTPKTQDGSYRPWNRTGTRKTL